VPLPMSATRAPCSAAVMDAEKPAEPAPITTRPYAPPLWPFARKGRSADEPTVDAGPADGRTAVSRPARLGPNRARPASRPSSIDSRNPGSSAERLPRQTERWSSEQKKAVVAHSEFAAHAPS